MTDGPPSLTPGLGAGLHPGISDEIYHKDPALQPSLSCTLGKVLIGDSPRHAYFKHPRIGFSAAPPKDDSTKAKDFGAIGHSLLLGAGAHVEVGDFKTWQSGDAKAFREVVRSRGNIPTLKKTYDRALAMQTGALDEFARLGFREQFDRSKKEVTIIWQKDGIWLRSKYDGLDVEESGDRATILDLKIVERAHPDIIERQVSAMHYDLQGVFYPDGLTTLFPQLEGRVDFIFLFVESVWPHCCIPVRLSGEFQVLGGMKFTRAKTLWKMARETGVWPGYADGVVSVSPKPWDIAREMEQEIPSFSSVETDESETDEPFA